MITTFTVGLNGRSKAVFVDTGGWIALVSNDDGLYLRANNWLRALRGQRRPLVTTGAVLLEVVDGLAMQRKRYLSATFRDLLQTTNAEVLEANQTLLERAWNFFEARPDKEWSLTDCLSFVAMNERHLSEALAHDHHFAQAGFAPLLRDDVP